MIKNKARNSRLDNNRKCAPGDSSCCRNSLNQPFEAVESTTAMGDIPRISGELTASDHLGAFKVRWGIGRMHYLVDPGLYALGRPDSDSPVLVTGNYKVSFDRLRSAYAERAAWILVLDTRGINVWCAAGKGTFGTRELVDRLRASGLAEIVRHRTLILPQLSAPGVSAPEVKQATGFKVIYGPVRARDLPQFMDSGMNATAGMRLKRFPVAERLALIPMELLPALKWLVLILPVFVVLGGMGFAGSFLDNAGAHGGLAAMVLTSGMLAGTVFTPLLLPWLPGRAFAVKGGIAGIIAGTAVLLILSAEIGNLSALMERLGLLLLGTVLASYLGLNFTGSSTYTSLSGVKKEMRLAVPVLIIGGAAGLLLWLGACFVV